MNQIQKMINVGILFSIVFVSIVLSLNIELRINEKTPINSRIGSIQNHLPAGILKYHHENKFVAMSTTNSQYFSIDKNTGEIKVIKLIDRELLCQSNKICKLEFTVNCLHQQNVAEIIEIKVIIKDINDNGCAFVPAPYQTVSWREDSRIDETSEFLNRPRDPDIDHSILKSTIKIVSGQEKFGLKITSTSSSEAPFHLELILKSELDYETDKYHFVNIEASDGIQEHACYLNVTVVVQDINDNSPRFEFPNYNLSIPEDFPLNKSIIELKAFDKDSGIHGQIIYVIDAYADQNIKDTFLLEKHSGHLYLKKSLNYFNCKSYLLTIEARNTELHSRLGTTKLQIIVLDINNEKPEINLYSSITGNTRLTIDENQSTEKDVAMVTVTDRDTGINAKVNCGITNVSVNDIIELRETPLEKTFRLIVAKPVDRELISEISALLVCTDLGQPAQTTTQLIRVEVVDKNDNAPIFLNPIKEINVTEDSDSARAAVDFRIYQFNATDQDSGSNAKLKYEIVSSDSNVIEMLKIDPVTGLLSTKGNLDKERVDYLKFKVTVTDSGQPSLHAEINVQINVDDFNDHAPRFSENTRYTFKVCENRPTNEYVGTMWARDSDFGENGKLNFFIERYSFQTPENVPFRLVAQLNPNYNRFMRDQDFKYRIDIKTTASIDRESIFSMGQIYPKYDFVVKAEDSGSPKLSHRISVKIEILDENDEAPVFDLPTRNITLIKVSHYESMNFKFGKIGANDRDEGSNGTVEFSIKNGDPEKKFHLHPQSGDLLLAKKLAAADAREYQLLIEAADKGNPSKSSTININILVDDSPPIGHHYIPNSLSVDAMNLYIIIAIVIASFIISVILLIAICVVLHKSKGRNHSFQSKFQSGVPMSNDTYGGNCDFAIVNFHAHQQNLSPTGSVSMLPLNPENAADSDSLFAVGNQPKFETLPTDFYRILNQGYQPQNGEEMLNNNDKDSGKGDSVDARVLYQQMDQGKYYGFLENLNFNNSSATYSRVSANSAPSSYDVCTLRRPLISFCKNEKSIDHQIASGKTIDNSDVICNINSGSFV